jgi:hypothetical protein
VLAIDRKQDLLSLAVEKNQIERSSSGAALTSSTKWKVFESLLHARVKKAAVETIW